ncbi:thioredoxin peroxidase dot5 [Tilletia horrida]|uniref:thioredoxin-dependent peroxiredoxin n=1 Tax=Tilletia horrida TaxID=155126 RepID=A0AAN6GPS0_9BASI|nr:thioredoxin peroxidase dot5 [Tilletia horrida]KAK0547511.1 thioredoxin peroxidase dot5 [Tilletia horrida]KAK0562995.1 thioredoxin peroxidase dot5 [Tilletia horrida]
MVSTRSGGVRSDPPAKTTSSSAPKSKEATTARKASASAPKPSASSSKGGAKELKVGDSLPAKDKAPELVAATADESKVTLNNLVEKSGKGVVIFFYPAANTPGCTNQAKLFNEHHQKFKGKGYTVAGSSKDKPEAQKKWHTKLGLQYDLYTDANGDTAELLGLLKAGRKVQRGVAVIEKTADGGKLAFGGAYGPQASLDEALKHLGA